MAEAATHYEELLAQHYTWMAGGAEAKFKENQEFFAQHRLIPPRLGGHALDLGAGSGFQTIPLARAGYEVIALDFSAILLQELKNSAFGLPVRGIQDDLLNWQAHVPAPLELVVCMGDTLPHLSQPEQVKTLLTQLYDGLEPEGHLVLTFRDFTSPLQGLDRFLPVKNDPQKIFTCFLEYEAQYVKVHDLIYTQEAGQWQLKKSFYRKLRLAPAEVSDLLEKAGFQLKLAQNTRGFVTLIAQK